MYGRYLFLYVLLCIGSLIALPPNKSQKKEGRIKDVRFSIYKKKSLLSGNKKSNDKSVACEICGELVLQAGYVYHLADHAHEWNMYPYYCKVHGIATISKTDFVRHLLTHKARDNNVSYFIHGNRYELTPSLDKSIVSNQVNDALRDYQENQKNSWLKIVCPVCKDTHSIKNDIHIFWYSHCYKYNNYVCYYPDCACLQGVTQEQIEKLGEKPNKRKIRNFFSQIAQKNGHLDRGKYAKQQKINLLRKKYDAACILADLDIAIHNE